MPDVREENPFESPQETSPAPRGKWAKVLMIVLGVLLTPVAAFIGGFCCCFGAMVTVGPIVGEAAVVVMLVSFILGAIAAGGGIVYAIARSQR